MREKDENYIRFIKEMLVMNYYRMPDSDVIMYLSCNEDDTVSITFWLKSAMGFIEDKSSLYHMDQITKYKSLQNIITSSTVAIDTMLIKYNPVEGKLEDVQFNCPRFVLENKPMGTYKYNKTLGKIVLSFDKDWYLSLSEDLKKQIKSNYLFSRKTGSWVSRAKFPNTYHAIEVAKKLGLERLDDEGEIKSFEQQMSDKAAKAENRAKRYETYAENAEKRAERLQVPFKEASRDIAFVTQPNISSASGRAFSNYRERLYRAYERGIEEFRKSEYYRDKALTASIASETTKPTDKAFCVRRMEEAEKSIRGWKKHLDRYYEYRDRMNKGETITLTNKSILTMNALQSNINRVEEGIERDISKWTYYDKCLQELGGVEYSKLNINRGDIVLLDDWGKCLVVGKGPKNISYQILEGGAKGFSGTAPYASIQKVLESNDSTEKEMIHPFNVGEEYTVERWENGGYTSKKVKVIKRTDKSVTLQVDGDSKPVLRRPSRRMIPHSDKAIWSVSVYEGYKGYITKEEE